MIRVPDDINYGTRCGAIYSVFNVAGDKIQPKEVNENHKIKNSSTVLKSWGFLQVK